jgi:predicted membrane chloride channel (bestrophin family)
MSRTFLFFYIYTLPSALLTASSTPEADLVILFIVTYGFIGLELISIELDDPFGEDVIDFDTLRSIQVSVERGILMETFEPSFSPLYF